MVVLSTSSQKRAYWKEWADHCRSGLWVDVPFMNKSTVGGVPIVWVDAMKALDMALTATGYVPRSAWAYNFRQITGSSYPCKCSDTRGCSLHGYGIAIDIDPRENPYLRTRTFRWSDTKFTPEQIAAVEAIRNTKGEQVWFWGGRWTTIKDYMHFEANVDPQSTEIDWSTVPGQQPPQEDEEMLKRGDAGNAVTKLQKALQAWDSRALPQYGADGDFGAETETWVKHYQFAADLPQTGQVGGVTMALLMEYVADYVGGGTVDAEARAAAAAAGAAAAGAQARASKAHERLDKAKAAL